MCGISGVWSSGSEKSDSLEKLSSIILQTLAHRGPDNAGEWKDITRSLLINHTRLSIQDLSVLGNQPMHSKSGRYVIAFNGEIYNHNEIRNNINKESLCSINWSSTSDTETLVEAIDFYGLEKTLKKLIGPFAFAVWDKKYSELFLVRDRFGEKPLYWGVTKSPYLNSKTFVFSSELSTISKIAKNKLKINLRALSSYFQFSCVQQPLSIYENINQLMPGSYLRVKSLKENFCSLNEFIEKKWWNFETINFSNEISISEYESMTHEYLRNAVHSQTISDVPFGAFLSGGIDSSLITSLLQTQSAEKIKTFTIGFPEYNSSDNDFDESKHATLVAKYLGTDHTVIPLTFKEILFEVQNISNIFSEPFADYSQVPSHLICKKIKSQGITVALSGDGGDELFGGYKRQLFARRVQLINRSIPKNISNYLLSHYKNLPKNIRITDSQITKLSNCFLAGDDKYKIYEALSSTSDKKESLFSFEVQKELNKNPVKLNFNNKLEIQEAFMMADINNYLLSDILVKTDRVSMGVGLEVRCPFLDYRLANLAFSLPLDLKIKRNNFKIISKHILRRILYKYVPQKIIDRPKHGFSMPLGNWLKGPLKYWANELLDPELIRRQGYLNSNYVRKIWSEHISNQKDHTNILWSIIMWQNWLNSQ